MRKGLLRYDSHSGVEVVGTEKDNYIREILFSVPKKVLIGLLLFYTFVGCPKYVNFVAILAMSSGVNPIPFRFGLEANQPTMLRTQNQRNVIWFPEIRMVLGDIPSAQARTASHTVPAVAVVHAVVDLRKWHPKSNVV